MRRIKTTKVIIKNKHLQLKTKTHAPFTSNQEKIYLTVGSAWSHVNKTKYKIALQWIQQTWFIVSQQIVTTRTFYQRQHALQDSRIRAAVSLKKYYCPLGSFTRQLLHTHTWLCHWVTGCVLTLCIVYFQRIAVCRRRTKSAMISAQKRYVRLKWTTK